MDESAIQPGIMAVPAKNDSKILPYTVDMYVRSTPCSTMQTNEATLAKEHTAGLLTEQRSRGSPCVEKTTSASVQESRSCRKRAVPTETCHNTPQLDSAGLKPGMAAAFLSGQKSLFIRDQELVLHGTVFPSLFTQNRRYFT